MLMLNLHPDEPYVPFVEPRSQPWWAYEQKATADRIGRPRRIVGRALIRAGQFVAAERRSPVLG